MTTSSPHVFISYVIEDSDRVDKLCSLLESAQIPYWRDRKDLGPGDQWKAKIREAIKDGALVFLACFSERSNARAKSVQHEELNLAVEEFRLRPPGATWLIPVRLDDIEIPDYKLTSTLTIRDLNWVDLFGARYPEGAVALTTRIHELLGQPGPDAATVVASVATMEDAARPAQMRKLTKEMLFDPQRRIELDDLVSSEATRVVGAMRDDDRFPLTYRGGEDMEAQLVDTARSYWELTEALCWSLQVAARWGEASDLTPWSNALHRIQVEGAKMKGGISALLGLRKIPLMTAIFTAGLTAVAEGRWANLRKLVEDVTVRDGNRGEVIPLIQAVDPYEPFDNAGLAPHALARSSREEVSVTEALKYYRDGGGKYHTAPAEWLHQIMRPVFSEQLPDDAIYDLKFDRAEVVLGLVDTDAHDRAGRQFGGTRWLGRSGWRSNHGYGNALEEVSSELEQQGPGWGPLTAGLFGGDVDRARAAIVKYTERFELVRRSAW